MQNQYSTRSPAVKRLMREAKELQNPTHMYHAQPIEDNLFEWHFTVRGAEDSDFAGGLYHGRITLPSEYPMKPPSIMLLTPNGRFQVNTKICLSISGYHPETWQPSWSIRTALLAIIGFMETPGEGAIGSLDYTKEERQQLAKKSQAWSCSTCRAKLCEALLSKDDDDKTRERDAQEAKELGSQIQFKDEKTVKSDTAKYQQEHPRAEQQPTSSSEAGVRQRATVSSSMSSPHEPMPELRQVNSNNDNRCLSLLLNILIVLIVVALAALIIRRVSLQALDGDGAAGVISDSIGGSSSGGQQESRPIIPPPGGQH